MKLLLIAYQMLMAMAITYAMLYASTRANMLTNATAIRSALIQTNVGGAQ